MFYNIIIEMSEPFELSKISYFVWILWTIIDQQEQHELVVASSRDCCLHPKLINDDWSIGMEEKLTDDGWSELI